MKEQKKSAVMDLSPFAGRQRVNRFTLIELLVVIAIIAILAAILMPALSSARQRAQSSTCQSNLKNTSLVLLTYAQDNGDLIMTVGTSGSLHWPSVYGRFTGNKYFNFKVYKKPEVSGNVTGYYHKMYECPTAASPTMNDDLSVHAYGMLSANAYAVNQGRFDSLGSIAKINKRTEVYYSAPGPLHFLRTAKVKQPLEWCLLVDNQYGIKSKYSGQSCAIWWPHSDNTEYGFALVHNGRGNIAFLDGHVNSRSRAEAAHGFMRIKGGLDTDRVWSNFTL